MSRIGQRLNRLKRSPPHSGKVVMMVKNMSTQYLKKWYKTKMPNRKQRKIIKHEMEKRVC